MTVPFQEHVCGYRTLKTPSKELIMGEAHKIGDSINSKSIRDVNPGNAGDVQHPFDVLEMYKQDRASTNGRFSAASAWDGGDSGKKLEDGARNLATDMTQGKYSDSEIAKKFTAFVKASAGHSASSVYLALNGAFNAQGAPWHVGVSVGENPEGTLTLFKNPPVSEDKILVQSQFFKPGEDTHAEFNPDKTALKKIAGDFAKENPDHLSAKELGAEVAKRIDEMKSAGAGPNDAEDAFNDALTASGQALRFNITKRGKVELEEHHRDTAVVQVDRSKL
jgi:hypothetical protein